jgi:hypothetical protein
MKSDARYLQVRMSNELRARLDAEAKKRGVKSTELTRALILEFCEGQRYAGVLRFGEGAEPK